MKSLFIRMMTASMGKRKRKTLPKDFDQMLEHAPFAELIAVTAADWSAQHQQLWQLLVPSSGAARTVQGEVIRLSGRISIEIIDNGGANWSADFKKMLKALVEHLGSAVPLSDLQQAEARTHAASLKNGTDSAEHTDRLCELAVCWVIANPEPIPLSLPSYSR